MIKDRLKEIKKDTSVFGYYVPISIPEFGNNLFDDFNGNIGLPRFIVTGKPLTLEEIKANIKFPKNYEYDDIITNIFTGYTKSGYDLDGVQLLGECQFYCSVENLKKLYAFLEKKYKEANTAYGKYVLMAMNTEDDFGVKIRYSEGEVNRVKKYIEKKLYDIKEEIIDYIKEEFSVLPYAILKFNKYKVYYSATNDPNNVIPIFIDKDKPDDSTIDVGQFSAVMRNSGYESACGNFTDVRITSPQFLIHGIRSGNGTMYGIRAWVKEPKEYTKSMKPPKVYKDEDK